MESSRDEPDFESDEAKCVTASSSPKSATFPSDADWGCAFDLSSFFFVLSRSGKEKFVWFRVREEGRPKVLVASTVISLARSLTDSVCSCALRCPLSLSFFFLLLANKTTTIRPDSS